MTGSPRTPPDEGAGGSEPRVIVVHPVVPRYRIDFFERLADHFGSRLVVYASNRDMSGLTHPGHLPQWARRLRPIRNLLPGLQWQPGAPSVPIRRGDILVISGVPRCLSNLVLLIKARLTGASAIWWGQYWSATSRPWRAALRIAIARLSHGMIFYTDAEKEAFLRSRAGRSWRLVFALNNGIETSEIETFRERFEPGARGRRLLFIGRLTPKARLDLLLHALADQACNDVALDVIGGGERETEARDLASSLGLGDRVTWRGPIINENDIADVANRCALFVYPGAVGLSLIHAFAYGLPAVVHDDRWRHYPEIAALEAGRNGLTFRKSDSQSLARTIDGALRDPDRLSRMSAAAVSTTRATFNAKDMTERFIAAVSAVQRARSSPSAKTRNPK